MTFQPILLPLGDSALLVQFGEEIDITVNRRVHTLAALIHAAPLPGVMETVPAYRTLLIHYDPLILMEEEIRTWVRVKLDQIEDNPVRTPRQLEIPVRYG